MARRDRRVEDAKDSWTRGALFESAPNGTTRRCGQLGYFVAARRRRPRKRRLPGGAPDDPPVSELGGVARIFRDVAALQRAADFWPGPGSASSCASAWCRRWAASRRSWT